MCVYVVVAHSNKGQHNISARFDVTFSFNYYHSQIDPLSVMRMGKMHFVPVCRSVFILARISIASVCKPRRHANKCRRQTRIAFIINSCDRRGSGHVAPTSGPGQWSVIKYAPKTLCTMRINIKCSDMRRTSSLCTLFECVHTNQADVMLRACVCVRMRYSMRCVYNNIHA